MLLDRNLIATQQGVLCSRLKHSWLENQVLNKTSDDVIYLWRGAGWTALTKEFSTRVQETITLTECLEQAYSSAQLVERLPSLATLPDDIKERIKAAVHAAYLESSGIMGFQEPLKMAARQMERALDKTLRIWNGDHTPANEDSLRSAWKEVRQRAQQLRDVLHSLPRIIMLP